MLDVAKLVAEAEAIGLEFIVVGEEVKVRFEPERRALLAPMIDRLRARREEVVALLKQRCWHCQGTRGCGCIACWTQRDGVRSTCVVCQGTGARRGWIQ